VVTAREAVGKPHRDCYPLAEAVEGVRETIDALRRGTYEVWNGAKAVPIEEPQARMKRGDKSSIASKPPIVILACLSP
jgi:hypothetical protein